LASGARVFAIVGCGLQSTGRSAGSYRWSNHENSWTDLRAWCDDTARRFCGGTERGCGKIGGPVAGADSSTSMSRSKCGKVYLVGAGPGDLGLVTLRAKECIERAEVIVYDHLANPEMLGWARDDAEIIYAGKKAGEHALSQEEINKLLVEKAHAGKEVVRLKGGDPFIF